MGNSPSKNDPLPNTSNVTHPGAGQGLATSDVEAEEPNLSALSRATGNGSQPHSNPLPPPHSQPESFSNFSFGEPNRAPVESAPKSASYSPASSPRAIPNVAAMKTTIKRPARASTGAQADFALSEDYTSQIDAAMALLVVTDRQVSASVSTASAIMEPDLALSLDSQRSDNLSVLPVFTQSEKDSSLVLSMYLLNNLPTSTKILAQPITSPLELSLAPIVEAVCELTPEPPLSSRKSSIAAAVAQAHLKPISTKTGHKPSHYSKSSGATSPLSISSGSPISSSPPTPPAVKLDFDIDDVISRLVKAGKRGALHKHKDRKAKDKLPVTTTEIKLILARLRTIFMEQPTLLQLAPPVKIVGDIHGQYHDLIRIFNACGYPPYTNYLFLGDYVDRGYKSLELILLLLCFKVKYPENFFMLRGNHESANITKIYGFYDECKRRLPLGSHRMWKSFIDVFNSLPIAATINDKIFCIHGGLSPELSSLKQIQQIQRPTDIPDRGLLADLLWSDPDPLVRLFLPHVWPKNDRGVSYCFGKKHVDHFLATFNMDLIVRGHMVVEDGYQFFNKRKLVTVFSAPNYCGEFNNYGAVMSVDRSLCCLFELIKP